MHKYETEAANNLATFARDVEAVKDKKERLAKSLILRPSEEFTGQNAAKLKSAKFADESKESPEPNLKGYKNRR